MNKNENEEKDLPTLAEVERVMPGIPEPDEGCKWLVLGRGNEELHKKHGGSRGACCVDFQWRVDDYGFNVDRFFYLEQVPITHGLTLPTREGYALGDVKKCKAGETIITKHGLWVINNNAEADYFGDRRYRPVKDMYYAEWIPVEEEDEEPLHSSLGFDFSTEGSEIVTKDKWPEPPEGFQYQPVITGDGSTKIIHAPCGYVVMDDEGYFREFHYECTAANVKGHTYRLLEKVKKEPRIKIGQVVKVVRRSATNVFWTEHMHNILGNIYPVIDIDLKDETALVHDGRPHWVDFYSLEVIDENPKTTIEQMYAGGDVVYTIFPNGNWAMVCGKNHLKSIVRDPFTASGKEYRWSNSPLTKYEDANPFIV